MIERDGEISGKRQAQLLDLSRSNVYYVAPRSPERDLRLMRLLDELHLRWPFYGALRVRLHGAGTVDEETDRRDHQRRWQIHLSR